MGLGSRRRRRNRIREDFPLVGVSGEVLGGVEGKRCVPSGSTADGDLLACADGERSIL